MGCSHSNASKVVVDPITQHLSGYGKVSMDTISTDIIVDETSKSVPLVEEEVKEYEQEAIVIAPVAEDKPILIELQVEVINEEPEVIEVVVEKPEVIEVVVEEPEVIEEPVVVEAEVIEKAPLFEEVEEEAEIHEGNSLVPETFAVVSTSAPTWTFIAEKVTFTVGVAFFNVSGFNLDGDEVYLIKRYSEFKVLHAEMAKLMTKKELPQLPGSSFLQGRNDKALLQEREDTFVQMLNAVAQHPEGSQSAAFTAFLA